MGRWWRSGFWERIDEHVCVLLSGLMNMYMFCYPWPFWLKLPASNPVAPFAHFLLCVSYAIFVVFLDNITDDFVGNYFLDIFYVKLEDFPTVASAGTRTAHARPQRA